MGSPDSKSSHLAAMKEEIQDHLRLIRASSKSSRNQEAVADFEFRKAPLFSSNVSIHMERFPSQHYGALGEEVSSSSALSSKCTQDSPATIVYANHDEPWSAFICGVQGTGKSHTLATLLENCLLAENDYGKAANPLAAMAFHFDHFSSFHSTQPCELAYFCTAGIKVRVLVSPRNLKAMKAHYEHLPNLPPGSNNPSVHPLKFSENQLNSAGVKALMSFGASKTTPLYMSVLQKLLDKLSEERETGVNFQKLKNELKAEKNFNAEQKSMLQLRLNLLDTFVATSEEAKRADLIWNFEPGSLTIIDLSSASVDEAAACGLYSICLGQFMARRSEIGRVVVLDEAHKFLTATGEAYALTENLISLVRQQRHLGVRVLIATQEPTLDTRLLDLCNVSIVHRFSARRWLDTLRGHLAGTAGSDSETEVMFSRIANLRYGKALVFSPTAMLHVERLKDDPAVPSEPQKLGDSYVEVEIRDRFTADGGQSITTKEKQSMKHQHQLLTGTFEERDGAQSEPHLESSGGVRLNPGDTSKSLLFEGNQRTIQPPDIVIEQALRNAVPQFWNITQPQRVNKAGFGPFISMRHTAAEVLVLDQNFFTASEWHERSKVVVKDEMKRLAEQ